MTLDEPIYKYRVHDRQNGPPGTMLNELCAVERAFRDYGFAPHPGSRLDQYFRLIRKLSKHRPGEFNIDHSSMSKLCQAAVELIDSRIIADNLLDRDEWHPKIVELLSGHEIPSKDSNARARNTQFELVLAASIAKAGFDPVSAEPDMLIESSGEVIAIAAKRVKTLAKARRRLSEAQRQIELSGYPGIIALEVSQVLCPKDLVTCGPRESEMVSVLDALYTNEVASHLGEMSLTLESDTVFGVIAHATYKCFETTRGCPVINWRRTTFTTNIPKPPRLSKHEDLLHKIQRCSMDTAARVADGEHGF